jgi:hypothetical protein
MDKKRVKPADDEQLLRVRARIASDAYWLEEMKRSTRALNRLRHHLQLMFLVRRAVKCLAEMAEAGVALRPLTPEFKALAQQAQALAQFTKLVGLSRRRTAMEPEQCREAWERFHVWCANELKAARRAARRGRPTQP